MRQTQSAAAVSFRDAREAVTRVIAARRVLPAIEHCALEEADGRVLAADVTADRNYPAVDRSARDGFAVRSADLPGRLRLIGEVRAGAHFAGSLNAGETIEIMTGAPVPDGADSIVMVEHVRRDGVWIVCDCEAPIGQFVNYAGGEARVGTRLLPCGTRIGYSEVGLLAAVGCTPVPVYARPRVAIVATGDELVAPQQQPAPYQIRNSNAFSLAAQVVRAGGIPEILGVAPDSEAETRALIDRGLASDLLLLSGGVSAGRYDFVESALRSLDAQFFFTRVAIQPGQPLVFGHARDRFFFGLPGNPASTMVTFELFARAALEMIGGQTARDPVSLNARLTAPFKHRLGVTRFLPALVSSDGDLTPIPWTGSSDIAALTRANGFMVVDAERAEWNAGDQMPVLIK